LKILVINSGSSSLKYKLFDMDNEQVMTKGIVERIGIAGSALIHYVGTRKKVIENKIVNHEEAMSLVLQTITDPEDGVLTSINEIKAVGHRVLHAGEDYFDSVLKSENVMKSIRKNITLGPLHNPPNIMGIEACEHLLPGVPQVCVFDTAFHQTIPPYAYLYGIPYEFYRKYGIRRYGFHGTSHRYVSARAAQFLKRTPQGFKVIVCHLGNGSSISAVQDGKCVDTTMGLTPLEGLMMGTRSGDLDPTVVTFLMKKEGWTCDEVNDFLNKNCGVLGLSGISSDFRDVKRAAQKGNKRAQLALDRFAYMVKKYIAAFIGILNGTDAVVFTAGLGENFIDMRTKICEDLDYLGIEIDSQKNQVQGKEAIISKSSSRVKVLVIPTNEELMIARDTYQIVQNSM
jgi:acetate kinase